MKYLIRYWVFDNFILYLLELIEELIYAKKCSDEDSLNLPNFLISLFIREI